MRKVILFLILFVSLIGCKKKESAGDLIADNQIIEYPIVFHILHEGAAIGSGDNVNASVVQYLITTLNNNFAASNTNIKFRLATKKPDNSNMAEPGIERINIGRTSVPYTEAYNDYNWGKNYVWNPDDYINVFIVDVGSSPNAGWTFTPFNKSNINSSQNIEGLATANGTDFSSLPNSQSIFLQKTLFEYQASINTQPQWPFAHEVGHYLGLFHTFSPACGSGSDYCDDTKHWSNAANPNSSSTNSRISCDNVNFQDYNTMSSTAYATNTSFTPNQVTRMRNASSYCLFRQNVWKSTK
jgi:zinc-dependent metalloproteinase lipoprotein